MKGYLLATCQPNRHLSELSPRESGQGQVDGPKTRKPFTSAVNKGRKL